MTKRRLTNKLVSKLRSMNAGGRFQRNTAGLDQLGPSRPHQPGYRLNQRIRKPAKPKGENGEYTPQQELNRQKFRLQREMRQYGRRAIRKKTEISLPTVSFLDAPED